MRSDKKAQIAIAIGWFVLLDILLRTTEGVVGIFNSTIYNLQGLFRGFGPPNGLWPASLKATIIFTLGVIGAVTLVCLSLMILNYLFKVWTIVIKLTRILVNFFFFEQRTTPQQEIKEEKNMLQSLFGEDVMETRDGLFWRSLRTLMAMWAIIIAISLISAVVTIILSYYGSGQNP